MPNCKGCLCRPSVEAALLRKPLRCSWSALMRMRSRIGSSCRARQWGKVQRPNFPQTPQGCLGDDAPSLQHLRLQTMGACELAYTSTVYLL